MWPTTCSQLPIAGLNLILSGPKHRDPIYCNFVDCGCKHKLSMSRITTHIWWHLGFLKWSLYTQRITLEPSYVENKSLCSIFNKFRKRTAMLSLLSCFQYRCTLWKKKIKINFHKSFSIEHFMRLVTFSTFLSHILKTNHFHVEKCLPNNEFLDSGGKNHPILVDHRAILLILYILLQIFEH